MKIAFYIARITDGGAERVMTNLANQMIYEGIQVTLITTHRDENEYFVAEGVERIVLDEIESNNGWKHNSIRHHKVLRSLCKNNQ